MTTVIKGTGCVGHPDNWTEEEFISCPDCDTPLEESTWGGFKECACKLEGDTMKEEALMDIGDCLRRFPDSGSLPQRLHDWSCNVKMSSTKAFENQQLTVDVAVELLRLQDRIKALEEFADTFAKAWYATHPPVKSLSEEDADWDDSTQGQGSELTYKQDDLICEPSDDREDNNE